MFCNSLKAEFDRELKLQADEYRQAREALAQRYKDALDQQAAELRDWDSQLAGALKQFSNDATHLLQRIDDQSETEADLRRIAFKETIDGLEARVTDIAVAASDQLAAAADLNAPTNARRDQPASDDPADSAPEINRSIGDDMTGLKLATTTYRAGQPSTLLVVENVSSKEILVDRIRFRPKPDSQFTLPKEREAASNLRLITFGPEDNTASDPKLHGTYDHRPRQPLKIAAGEKVSFRFSIHDPTHAGWGFSVRMVMDYEDANGERQMLIAESAKVGFTGG